MTYAAELFVQNDSHVLQGRLSSFLRRRYPPLGAADALARDLQINPRTARNYLNNYWPGARAWRAIVRQFGRDVLEAVFEPEIDETRARLAAEIRALEERLDDQKAALRRVGGRAEGHFEAPHS